MVLLREAPPMLNLPENYQHGYLGDTWQDMANPLAEDEEVEGKAKHI